MYFINKNYNIIEKIYLNSNSLVKINPILIQ